MGIATLSSAPLVSNGGRGLLKKVAGTGKKKELTGR